MTWSESAVSENLNVGNNPEPNPGETPEKNPETATKQLVDKATSTTESKETADSSGWKKKAKDFFQTPEGKALKYTGYGAGIVGGGLLIWVLKDFYLLWKFGKTFIEKGGKMSYADGKKIAEDAFSLLGGDKKKG